MRTYIVLAALVFAGLAFAPGLRGPFVHDDLPNLSIILAAGNGWHAAFDAILSNGSGLLRRPLSNASFLLNARVLGDSAAAFKAVNLALHLLVGFAAYRLANVLLDPLTRSCTAARRQGIALVAAALWVAHPLNTSTVLYVVQRMTMLAALFSLLAVWCLSQAWRNDAPAARWKALAGFCAMTLAAVLSKENGVLTPLYALAAATLLAWPQAHGFLARHRATLLCAIALPLALGAAGLLIGWDRFVADYAVRDFTLDQRLATQAVVLWQYLFHILVPVPQWMHFFWDGIPTRDLGDGVVLASITAWIAIAGVSVLLWKRTPLPLFALLWYLGGHAMESSVFPLELAYEHRNYLPMFGPLLAIVAGAAQLIPDRVPMRTVALGALSLFMLATGLRSLTWSNVDRLAAHEVSIAPNSLRAHNLAFGTLVSRQHWDAADMELDEMRRLASGAWVESNALYARCLGHPRPVDTGILTTLRASAHDERTQRGLQQVAGMYSMGCIQPLGIELEPFLVDMGAASEQQHDVLSAADYHYMAGSLAWSRGDFRSSRTHVEKALALTPDVSTPWEQLVRIGLATGDLQLARRALGHAETIWAAKEPWRSYRSDEWRAAISDAERGAE